MFVCTMLQDAIVAQKRQYDIDEKKLSAAKGEMKKRNLSRNKNIFDKIYAESTERRRKLLEIISEKGASLTTLPIKKEGCQFDKCTYRKSNKPRGLICQKLVLGEGAYSGEGLFGIEWGLIRLFTIKRYMLFADKSC